MLIHSLHNKLASLHDSFLFWAIDQNIHHEEFRKKPPKLSLYIFLFLVFYFSLDSTFEIKVLEFLDTKSLLSVFLSLISKDLLTGLVIGYPFLMALPLFINLLFLIGCLFHSFIPSKQRKQSRFLSSLTRFHWTTSRSYPLVLDFLFLRFAAYPIAFDQWENKRTTTFCLLGSFLLAASTFLISFFLILYRVPLKTKDFHSAPGSRVSLLILVVKAVIAIDCLLNHENKESLPVFIFELVLIGALLGEMLQLPFYHFSSNKAYLSFGLCLAFIKTEKLLSIFLDFSSKSALLSLIFIKFLSLPLLARLGFSYCSLRKNWLTAQDLSSNNHLRLLQITLKLGKFFKKPKTNSGSISEGILFKKGLIHSILEESPQKPSEKDLDFIEKFRKSLRNRTKTRKLSVQEELLIDYFLVRNSKSFVQGFSRVSDLVGKNPRVRRLNSFKMIERIFRVRCRKLKNKDQLTCDEIMAQVHYETELNGLKAQGLSPFKEIEALRLFLSDAEKLKELFWTGAALNCKSKEFLEKLRVISEKFPKKKFHLMIGAVYLEFLRGAYQSSKKMMEKYRAMHHIARARADQKVTDVFEEDSTKSGVAVFRSMSNGSLKLQYSSSYFGRVFGHYKKNLKGKEPEDFLPFPFAPFHKGIVRSFMKRSQGRIIGITRYELFGQHSLGFLVPINFITAIYVPKNSELNFISGVKKKQEPNNVMLCSPNGSISLLGKDGFSLLNIKGPVRNLNVFSLCPELEQVFQIFSVVSLEKQWGRETLEKLRSSHDGLNDEARSKRQSPRLLKESSPNEEFNLDISEGLSHTLDPNDHFVQKVYSIFTDSSKQENVLLFDVPRRSQDFDDFPQLEEKIAKTHLNHCMKVPFSVQIRDQIVKEKYLLRFLVLSPGTLNERAYLNFLLSNIKCADKYNLAKETMTRYQRLSNKEEVIVGQFTATLRHTMTTDITPFFQQNTKTESLVPLPGGLRNLQQNVNIKEKIRGSESKNKKILRVSVKENPEIFQEVSSRKLDQKISTFAMDNPVPSDSSSEDEYSSSEEEEGMKKEEEVKDEGRTGERRVSCGENFGLFHSMSGSNLSRVEAFQRMSTHAIMNDEELEMRHWLSRLKLYFKDPKQPEPSSKSTPRDFPCDQKNKETFQGHEKLEGVSFQDLDQAAKPSSAIESEITARQNQNLKMFLEEAFDEEFPSHLRTFLKSSFFFVFFCFLATIAAIGSEIHLKM